MGGKGMVRGDLGWGKGMAALGLVVKVMVRDWALDLGPGRAAVGLVQAMETVAGGLMMVTGAGYWVM
jgi:hypothetical protein